MHALPLPVELAPVHVQVRSLRSHNPSGGIEIREVCVASAQPSQPVTAEEKQQQADADYARQLQAKLDAQEARGGPKSATLQLLDFCCLHCTSGALHSELSSAS